LWSKGLLTEESAFKQNFIKENFNKNNIKKMLLKTPANLPIVRQELIDRG
jgi:hypothetical protein